jgi:hypothetical protein
MGKEKQHINLVVIGHVGELKFALAFNTPFGGSKRYPPAPTPRMLCNFPCLIACCDLEHGDTGPWDEKCHCCGV